MSQRVGGAKGYGGGSSGGHSTSRKKISVSFVIRDVEEELNRAGVNAIRFDAANRHLYTAGRDSIIRCWDTSNSNSQKTCVSRVRFAYLNFQHFHFIFSHSRWVTVFMFKSLM